MRIALIIALLSVGLVACVPDYGLDVSDYRTVITLRDTSTDFTTYRTYVLLDTVYHIFQEGVTDDITRKYDQELLDGVAANLDAYGWVRVYDTTEGFPDALVKVCAAKNITTGYYWDYWYGGWYPWYGWGWYYPYYPPGSWNTYTYATGSVIVEMDRVAERTSTDSIAVRPIWVGSTNGLLNNVESADAQLIRAGVRQMFTQSPYLNVTGE